MNTLTDTIKLKSPYLYGEINSEQNISLAKFHIVRFKFNENSTVQVPSHLEAPFQHYSFCFSVRSFK